MFFLASGFTGGLPSKLGWYLNHRFFNHTATGFRSLAYAFQPKPLSFQRQGTAAGERVVKGR